MWKEYSTSYLKYNKASGISIMISAFVATLFLSLICSLFYNFWKYDTNQIIYEEGSWQGRLVGEITDSDIETIKHFANVTKVETYPDKYGQTVADIYFENRKDTYNDMHNITMQLNLNDVVISYHDTLLSQYLIFDPMDNQPPLLLRFFIIVMLVTGISLVLMIQNAFAASMNARIHQLGILSSIGATPRQIKTCLLQEAFALCSIPIFLGSIAGSGLCVCFLEFVKYIGSGYQSIPVKLQYHPLIFLITILASVLTVFLSAWIPARKMSKITPLQAVQNVTEQFFKKKKNLSLLSLVFGAEGELAGNALKGRRKELRISAISLTLSFFSFTMFLVFVTLSNISTKYTYFEKYKDAWDVMATIKNTNMEDMEDMSELTNMEGVKSDVVYQKATAYTLIKEDEFSSDLQLLGDIRALFGSSGKMIEEGTWLVEVPILVLDNAGFIEYCKQIGVEPEEDGAIVLNRIWDSIHSNFRYPEYIPFIKQTKDEIVLTNETGKITGAKINSLFFTTIPPILREEYENNALVQIMPLSLWKEIKEQVSFIEPDTNIRILSSKDSMIYEIERMLRERLSANYIAEIENRIQKEIQDKELWKRYKIIVGALCALLGLIGIANIFSHTLGFIYQRKREFARYLSVGVTPAGIKKMLWIEVFVIAGKPLLITAPLAVLFTVFAVKASYLDFAEIFQVLPVLPILLFLILIYVFVGFAYYIGGKRLLQSDLSEALRNDSMV